MEIPQWVAILLASMVLLFGCYRMYLAVAGPSNEERAKARSGMLAMSRRSHGLVAIMFFLVGGALMGTAFGWKPFGTKVKTAPAERPAGGTALPVR